MADIAMEQRLVVSLEEALETLQKRFSSTLRSSMPATAASGGLMDVRHSTAGSPSSDPQVSTPRTPSPLTTDGARENAREDSVLGNDLVPQMDFPQFDGEDASTWLDKCAAYFTLYNIPEYFRVTAATLHLSGQATQWFQSCKDVVGILDWDQFRQAVLTEFEVSAHKDQILELLTLKQSGSVEDFRKDFESLVYHIRLYENNLSDTFLVTQFVHGLKHELRALVDLQMPESVSHAACLASKHEKLLGNQSATHLQQGMVGQAIFTDDSVDEGVDTLYGLVLEEESGDHQPPLPAESRALSAPFHHKINGGVGYTAFDTVPGRIDMKVLDPAFTACKEEVTVLASTGDLVCLANNANLYIAVNPAFQIRIGYTVSGMPLICSMECLNLTIKAAATGWVFVFPGGFTFDPGTAIEVFCNTQVQREPWPPPFPLVITMAVFYSSGLEPWPNFLLSAVFGGGFMRWLWDPGAHSLRQGIIDKLRPMPWPFFCCSPFEVLAGNYMSSLLEGYQLAVNSADHANQGPASTISDVMDSFDISSQCALNFWDRIANCCGIAGHKYWSYELYIKHWKFCDRDRLKLWDPGGVQLICKLVTISSDIEHLSFSMELMWLWKQLWSIVMELLEGLEVTMSFRYVESLPGLLEHRTGLCKKLFELIALFCMRSIHNCLSWLLARRSCSSNNCQFCLVLISCLIWLLVHEMVLFRNLIELTLWLSPILVRFVQASVGLDEICMLLTGDDTSIFICHYCYRIWIVQDLENVGQWVWSEASIDIQVKSCCSSDSGKDFTETMLWSRFSVGLNMILCTQLLLEGNSHTDSMVCDDILCEFALLYHRVQVLWSSTNLYVAFLDFISEGNPIIVLCISEFGGTCSTNEAKRDTTQHMDAGAAVAILQAKIGLDLHGFLLHLLWVQVLLCNAWQIVCCSDSGIVISLLSAKRMRNSYMVVSSCVAILLLLHCGFIIWAMFGLHMTSFTLGSHHDDKQSGLGASRLLRGEECQAHWPNGSKAQAESSIYMEASRAEESIEHSEQNNIVFYLRFRLSSSSLSSMSRVLLPLMEFIL